MKKLTQNKVAESTLAFPMTCVYTVAVWLMCGLVEQEWWLQIGCFAITTYLVVLLNNMNALIRIYSRMISCTFLVLTCCACFLFPLTEGAIASLFLAVTYLFLFQTYQDKTAVGKTFYAFVAFGLASLGYVHILYYIPLLWLLMGTNIWSLSWRTWAASLLGMLTPYWFALCWFAYQGNPMALLQHFLPLGDFQPPFDYSAVTTGQVAVFALLVVLLLTGIIHFVRQGYADSIRIRMLYGFFVWIGLLTIVFLVLQPQHYDLLLRVLILSTAPLTAHFITFTSTKTTNVAFFIIIALAVLITAYNLWTILSLY